MDTSEIVRFLRNEIEPIPDLAGSPSYRAAALLKDGLSLPCVLFCSKSAQVALALRRFDETRPRSAKSPGLTSAEVDPYRSVVEVFAAAGNRVNLYDIASIQPSAFAIPAQRLREIPGETSMSWTQFIGVMRDGSEFSFGTSYHLEFFEMPPGYSGEDVVEIRPHRRGPGALLNARPFFNCFVDGL